jgi:hypothetical protein
MLPWRMLRVVCSRLLRAACHMPSAGCGATSSADEFDATSKSKSMLLRTTHRSWEQTTHTPAADRPDYAPPRMHTAQRAAQVAHERVGPMAHADAVNGIRTNRAGSWQVGRGANSHGEGTNNHGKDIYIQW